MIFPSRLFLQPHRWSKWFLQLLFLEGRHIHMVIFLNLWNVYNRQKYIYYTITMSQPRKHNFERKKLSTRKSWKLANTTVEINLREENTLGTRIRRQCSHVFSRVLSSAAETMTKTMTKVHRAEQPNTQLFTLSSINTNCKKNVNYSNNLYTCYNNSKNLNTSFGRRVGTE